MTRFDEAKLYPLREETEQHARKLFAEISQKGRSFYNKLGKFVLLQPIMHVEDINYRQNSKKIF